jgi:hypothetical protein
MYVSFLIKIVVLDVYWIVEEPPVRLEIRPPVVLPVGNQARDVDRIAQHKTKSILSEEKINISRLGNSVTDRFSKITMCGQRIISYHLCSGWETLARSKRGIYKVDAPDHALIF